MVPYNLTADDLAKMNTDTIVIPVGSTEQHGPHLPLSTDVKIGGIFADGIAEAISAYVTPVIPISMCREHMGKKGSVFMKPETCYQMLYDIVMSAKEQGFKKCVLFVSHGGVFVAGPLCRQINGLFNKDFMICKVEVLDLMADAGEVLDSKVYMHADEYETSIMLARFPETVHMDRAVDCTPDVPREILNYGSIFRVSPSGVWGVPSLATAEKGEKLIKLGIQSAVKKVKDTFAFIEAKEKFGYSDF